VRTAHSRAIGATCRRSWHPDRMSPRNRQLLSARASSQAHRRMSEPDMIEALNTIAQVLATSDDALASCSVADRKLPRARRALEEAFGDLKEQKSDPTTRDAAGIAMMVPT